MDTITRRHWVRTAGALLFAKPARAFDVRDFHATGDGKTVNTIAIQKAIDVCAADGGGTVLVPNGKYVTGTLLLKSNVTLSVAAGGSLLGSPDIADYAAGTHHNMYAEPQLDRCLIFARDATNVAVEGHGVMDGQGRSFPNRGDVNKNRPMLLRFLNCRNLFLRDITLLNPASWTSSFLYCDEIIVDGINISSRANSAGDGCDFDGCRNVRVANSSFDNSDDSISLQTSRPDKPISNVTITNCIMTSKWAAVRLGPLSRGDFADVTVSNCVFHDVAGEGLKIQMAEGGQMSDLLFSNIIMKNVPRPVFVTLNSFSYLVDAPAGPPPVGSIRNVMFSNMRIEGGVSSVESRDSFLAVIGVPGHGVENVTFSGIHFTAAGGGTKEDAHREIPELTKVRPEHGPLGPALPAYGLYARHVKGLTLNNLRIDADTRDLRPAIVCDDTEDVRLSAVRLAGDPDAESLIRLQNTRNVLIQGSGPLGEIGTFARIEGRDSSQIGFAANDLRRVKRPVDHADEVPLDAVDLRP